MYNNNTSGSNGLSMDSEPKLAIVDYSEGTSTYVWSRVNICGPNAAAPRIASPDSDAADVFAYEYASFCLDGSFGNTHIL